MCVFTFIGTLFIFKFQLFFSVLNQPLEVVLKYKKQFWGVSDSLKGVLDIDAFLIVYGFSEQITPLTLHITKIRT